MPLEVALALRVNKRVVVPRAPLRGPLALGPAEARTLVTMTEFKNSGDGHGHGDGAVCVDVVVSMKLYDARGGRIISR